MLSVLRLAQPRFSDHIISMPANAETQFNLFDRPSRPVAKHPARSGGRIFLTSCRVSASLRTKN
jgi:hypothetical protein